MQPKDALKTKRRIREEAAAEVEALAPKGRSSAAEKEVKKPKTVSKKVPKEY